LQKYAIGLKSFQFAARAKMRVRELTDLFGSLLEAAEELRALHEHGVRRSRDTL